MSAHKQTPKHLVLDHHFHNQLRAENDFPTHDSHEKPLILLPDSTKQFLVLLVAVLQFFDRFDQFSQPALVLA